MTQYDTLLKNPFFSTLQDDELSRLTGLAIARNYVKGEWIVYLEDDFPNLFLVVEGKINAVKESSQGRTLIVVSIGPGEIFWGPSFFIPCTPMPVALVASEPSHLLLWRQADLLPILLKNGRMSWELAQLLVRRMLYASDFVQELAFQPVKGRLARLLLDLYGERSGLTTSRDLTLDEMAAHIGTTREMVCKQLSRFAEEGAIDIRRTEFRIADRSRLEHAAKKEK